MNEHNAQLLDKYKTALSRTEGKKAKIAGLKREMENTEAALAKKTGDLESTKAELKTKMESHREETLALKTTINEEKQRRIDDVKAKNIELLENKTSNNSRLNEMQIEFNKKVEAAKVELATANAKSTQQQNTISDLESGLQSEKQDKGKIQADLEANVQNLEEQVSASCEEIPGLLFENMTL